jgi:hypothetical protein
MEMVVFWALFAIVVLAVGYVWARALNLRTRKPALERDPARSDATSQTKQHGLDLQAHRKTYDDVT